VHHAAEIEAAVEEYKKEEIYHFAHEASLQERACYGACPDKEGVNMQLKPRVVEIIEFANRMGYKKLGVAFCGGLHREAAKFVQILKSAGFDVVSAMCKVGGVDKSLIGVDGEGKICGGGHETMCNPIAQAKILNAEKTEFNILLGLCVGHDSLFLKYSEAMCTVFAVKDRLMGHNPLAAVYTSDSYYKYLK
jgi:uncharacterized metal-binding protein